jgi:hypothetical protein
MILDSIKAKVLIDVAEGATYAEAAQNNNLKVTQIRHAVEKVCRILKLPSELSDIRTNPNTYIEAAKTITEAPKYALRGELRKSLETVLRMRSSDQLTPAYLSKFTASSLLNIGISMISLAEIQEWMANNETSLKHGELDSKALNASKMALWVLDAFGFDVQRVHSELNRICKEEAE